MTRHGVVLGGGGVLGVAWELGVLAALAQAGLDPVGTAAVVVGTSAGSVVGAQSVGGADLAELVAAQHAPPDERSARSGEIMAMLDFQLLADLFVRWTGAWPMTEDTARDCCELALKQTTIDEETFVGMIAATLERELAGPRDPGGDGGVHDRRAHRVDEGRRRPAGARRRRLVLDPRDPPPGGGRRRRR